MLKKIYLLAFLLNLSINANVFINRWGFQEMADHIFDTTKDELSANIEGTFFDINAVKKGDVIFVRRNSLHEFMTKIHQQIKQPYILLSHVDDMSAPSRYQSYLNDKKLIAWFGIHPNISNHPKFHAIPIGIFPDKRLHINKEETEAFMASLRSKITKSKMLYMNFSIWTNPNERARVRNMFIKEPYCFTQDKRLPFKEYMVEMAQFKFVLSPTGNGLDCYRTWEAIFAGCIPIVKSSFLNKVYEDLPILVITDWKQINLNFLNNKYKELSTKKYNTEKLYMDYWINKIKNVKASANI